MWKQDAIDRLIAVYNGNEGTQEEKDSLHDYMMFYGTSEEIGNPHYCFGYETLMKMYNNKTYNKFLWIGYQFKGNDYTTIYIRRRT